VRGRPTNPNSIPDQPYTAAQVKTAKKSRGLQDRAPTAVAAPGGGDSPSPGPDEEPLVVGPGVDDPPEDPDAGAEPSVDTSIPLEVSTGSVDELLYNFWPQLPWDKEPDLPNALVAGGDDITKAAWLRTKPLKGEDD
jgi:hypothetical protein